MTVDDGKKSGAARRMALDLKEVINCGDIGLDGEAENCFIENEECLFFPPLDATNHCGEK